MRKYIGYVCLFLVFASLISHSIYSNLGVSILYSRVLLNVFMLSMLLLFTFTIVIILKGDNLKYRTKKSQFFIISLMMLVAVGLIFQMILFAVDGFGLRYVEETKQFKGLSIETAGTGLSKLVGAMSGTVIDEADGQTYEFGVNDPNSADLRKLFMENSSSLPNIAPYYKSNSFPQSFRVKYLPNTRIIISAKLIEVDVSSIDGENNLLAFVSNIYSDKKYSNGSEALCTQTLLKSPEDVDYNVDKNACPDIDGYDFFAKPYNQTMIQEYVILNDFLNNSKPVERYLLLERDTASSSKIYKEIYSRFVYAKTVKDMPERLSLMHETEYDENSLLNVFRFDFMKVSLDIDLAIVTDISMSGAYNFADYLYQINLTKDGIHFTYPMLIDDLTHYTRKTNNLSDTADVKEKKFIIDTTNSFFNHKNSTFNIYGFKPFGLYPCNITKNYSFFEDRLILTSKEQAIGCKKVDIELPNDIQDDFDSTSVEIYKIKKEVLEKAKEITITQ